MCSACYLRLQRHNPLASVTFFPIHIIIFLVMFFLILGISKDMKSLNPAIHDKIGKYFVDLYGEFHESSNYFR